MKCLTETECLRWIHASGVQGEFSTALDLLSALPNLGLDSMNFALPRDPGRRVALARAIFWQSKYRASVLVWLRNWMVWPSSGHLPLVLRLRQALGCNKLLEDAPGNLLETNELEDALSLFIVALEFSWDCFVADAELRLICFASHDEKITLMSTDKQFLSAAAAALESAQLCTRLSSSKETGMNP